MKIGINKKVWLLLLPVIGLFFQSCDPYYSIRIENNSEDTAIVTAHTTINFQPRESEILKIYDSPDSNIVKFKIPPGSYFSCGNAIAGLEDEIPFKKLKIETAENSIVAQNQAEVLSLFEKNLWGNLSTPYRIVIK